MSESDRGQGKSITSREVMHRTGISRATLNNYISMGMIPFPVVRKPDGEAHTKARRIGYFPESVLNLIDRLRYYKENGYSIKEIQKLFAGRSLDLGNDTAQACSFYNKSSNKSPHSPCHATEELFPLERNEELTILHKRKVKGGKASVEAMFKEGIPIPISFSVLSAQLHDMPRISAEMLPEDFFKLIRQVWSCANAVLGQYIGIHGRNVHQGILYYFIDNEDSNYLMNAVLAALELKDGMKEMDREWKGTMQGDQDYFLNIGLSEGNDYFGCISTKPWRGYLAMGDASEEAVRLSDFGERGSIWAAKGLLTRLNRSDRMRIEYGIRRRASNGAQIVERRFSRVEDLKDNDKGRILPFKDMDKMIATEILNYSLRKGNST